MPLLVQTLEWYPSGGSAPPARRWVPMAIVSFFTLSSATSSAMLIAARAIQGIGSGGIYIILYIMVLGPVPLLARGDCPSYLSQRALTDSCPSNDGLSMIVIFLFVRTAYNRS
ncbi:hypothetical protein LY78DRAFT_685770 [Colletotrichum sublineola]|nr:hypothetical protein LY78DRAFT_685770 [Colletotrichum sublineola]